MQFTRNLFCLCLIVLFCGSAFAIEEFRDDQLNVIFPLKLGALKLESVQHGNPEAGNILRYGYPASLVKADVYVYGDGNGEIEDGIASERIKTELQQVLLAIQYFEKMGLYQDIKELSQGAKKYDQCHTDFLWSLHRYKQTVGADTGERLSETYLTAMKGKFVKVRFTYTKREQSQKEADATNFMNALCAVLQTSS